MVVHHTNIVIVSSSVAVIGLLMLEAEVCCVLSS